MMNNNNEYFCFNLNKSNHHTPNRKEDKSTSQIGTPMDYNNAEFPYDYESNGRASINDISDEDELAIKFKENEALIKKYCIHYLTLSDVFYSVDKKIKNKIIQYLTNFNSRCQKELDNQTDNLMVEKKNEKNIKQIEEDNKRLKKENNHLIEEFKIQKEEYKKQIEELKQTIKEGNKKIKENENTIMQKDKEIEDKNNKILKLKEINMNSVSGPSECINISYSLEECSDNFFGIGIPKQKEFKAFSEEFKTTEDDFNKYAKTLVDTINNTLDKFKELYFKIKGKNWLDSDNFLNKVYFSQTYNINQKFSWSNLINSLFTLQGIISQIFELVDPTQKCDPKKLNEDSCEFLLNYIVGLRKLFFVQKNILDNTFNTGDTYAVKIQNFESFKKVTEEAEKFFSENNHIINNQSYFGRFQDELKEENVKDLSVDEYIKNIKSVLVQAKIISDKSENEYNEYIKNLELQNNRTTTENIEIELSNTKSKKINSDNGI